MKYEDLPRPTHLDAALAFATEAHRGRKDKAGLPEILHPLKVLMALADPNELQEQAALVHDTVEDTGATLDDVEAALGPDVRRVVDHLSRREGEIYLDYIDRLMGDPDAMAVKAADLWVNYHRSPLAENWASLRKRYEAAAKKIGITFT